MAVRLRPIVFEDAASYRRCFDSVAKDGFLAVEKAPPLSVVRSNLRKSLRKKTPFLVAVEDERVVGWAAVFRSDIPSLGHIGDLMVCVLAEYRGVGLGTRLATRVLKIARGKVDSVLFSFFGKNRPARRLAKALGFDLCGRERKFAKPATGYDDLLTGQKMFQR